jgi:hypothetical protein
MVADNFRFDDHRSSASFYRPPRLFGRSGASHFGRGWPHLKALSSFLFGVVFTFGIISRKA